MSFQESSRSSGAEVSRSKGLSIARPLIHGSANCSAALPDGKERHSTVSRGIAPGSAHCPLTVLTARPIVSVRLEVKTRRQKETDMQRKLTWGMLLGTAIVMAAALPRPVLATPATGGFVSTTLALGRFGDINVFNHLIPPDFWKSRHNSDVWLSWQKTKGLSDVYVQSNVFPAGASSGWHTHPGHSLIIVAA